MTKLDKLLELSKLEKQNRRNRLEDKLRQQEYYGEIEELFDPLTKTLNDYNEKKSVNNQTLRAINWQNQEMDKQTKANNEAGSHFNKALMMSNESLMKSNEATLETRDMLFIIEKNTTNIIHIGGSMYPSPAVLIAHKSNLVLEEVKTIDTSESWVSTCV